MGDSLPPSAVPDGGPEATRRPRVALVHEQRLVVQGLLAWLSLGEPRLDVVAAVQSWDHLLPHLTAGLDVVLLDPDLPDDVPSAAKIALLNAARIATVIVTAAPDAVRVRGLLGAGAASVLLRSDPAEEVVRAARCAAQGERHVSPALAAMLDHPPDGAGDRPLLRAPALSPQEVHALVWYASGLPLKSVARRMAVSQSTAKDYLDRARRKYASAGRAARTKVELHQRAVEDGLLGRQPS